MFAVSWHLAPCRAEQRLAGGTRTLNPEMDRSSNRAFPIHANSIVLWKAQTQPGCVCVSCSLKAGAWLSPGALCREGDRAPPVSPSHSGLCPPSQPSPEGRRTLDLFIFSWPGGHCPFHAKEVVGAAGTELFCKAFD